MIDRPSEFCKPNYCVLATCGYCFVMVTISVCEWGSFASWLLRVWSRSSSMKCSQAKLPVFAPTAGRGGGRAENSGFCSAQFYNSLKTAMSAWRGFKSTTQNYAIESPVYQECMRTNTFCQCKTLSTRVLPVTCSLDIGIKVLWKHQKADDGQREYIPYLLKQYYVYTKFRSFSYLCKGNSQAHTVASYIVVSVIVFTKGWGWINFNFSYPNQLNELLAQIRKAIWALTVF